MRHLLFLTHRYLGIGIGLIMVIWCLSGFVMMYVPYPDVTKDQALQGLAPLDLDGCCDTSQLASLGLVDVNRFTVEMLGDTPVVRFRASGRQNPMVDLGSGKKIDEVGATRADVIAQVFKRHSGIEGDSLDQRKITRDQWTVTNYYDYYRPLYRFTADDPRNTQWYISSTTGETVQFSTGPQRFWNWLGSVPHWLYPTILRQHDALWTWLVIGLSLAGVFLTIVGLYVGISQYRTLPSGRKSPYRGVALWHHYLGLIFGLFILTWVTSGLFSMNPWQLFDLGGGTAERNRLQGLPLGSGDVERFLGRLPQADLPADTVRIEGYALLGKLHYLAYQRNGDYRRFDGQTMQPRPIESGEWKRLKEAAAGRESVAEAKLLSREDGYYYGHKSPRELPVQRIILDNADQTRLYLNAISGELAARFDRDQRIYRWLFSGLHQLDLSALIRSRPLWDLLMWILLTGVTAGTATGAYMGIKRLTR